MRVIADLHIHSRYSRATSEQMGIKEIAKYAAVKGLQVVGTGDFTHPKWLQEIKETLIPETDTNLFKAVGSGLPPIYFMLTTEVCTIYDFEGKNRKVHHVIITPTLETASQINQALARFGSLESDGRPILSVTSPELVETIMEVSDANMVFPAHAWTPWFGVFGAFSGFNSLRECYQDMTKDIHALETGLSSDPPMNWRLSALDNITLVSNSDCHSFWPWRLGREANLFELKTVSYREIVDAIRLKDASRFKLTMETDPAYGKYHWSGHRNCNIAFSSKEALKFNNMCPVCGRRLTEGVEQRVEKLADRSAEFKPSNVPGFLRLLPLSEIIATVLNMDSPSAQKVWKSYNALVSRFGDEYTVLMETSLELLQQTVEDPIAEAIVKVREGAVTVIAGYDGVYGKLDLKTPPSLHNPLKAPAGRVQQSNLADFW